MRPLHYHLKNSGDAIFPTSKSFRYAARRYLYWAQRDDKAAKVTSEVDASAGEETLALLLLALMLTPDDGGYRRL